jgi:hypothetical protein
MRWLAVLPLFALASACDSCGSSHAVPFGLDAGRPRASTTEPSPDPRRERPSGRSLPEGTRRVDVEGAPIEYAGSLRALWADDVDADGDRDAISIAGDASGSALLLSRREGSSFAAPRVIARASFAQGCAIEAPSLEPVGESWLSARVRHACEGSSQTLVWLLSIEHTPRVLERFAILDAQGRAEGAIDLAFSSDDTDDDGRTDLVVTVSLDTEADEPTTIALPWLDRPSGLARDAAEPERTFEARSREALRALSRQAARALSESRSVAALHEAICREPGRARIRIGESDGLGCGVSEGAGRAVTTAVRAAASRGDLLSALAWLEHMRTSGLRMNDERWQAAREAIARAPATSGVTLREGPEHAAPSSTIARSSALAFLDEDRLLLRGDAPRIWNLRSGELTPAEPAYGDFRILDPSGAFAVAAIERRCAGQVLRVVASNTIAQGRALGSTHSSPLLAPREPPPGAPCPDLTPALRRDTAGFAVLGWAPQGIVAARGNVLSVVALDLQAQPAGSPEVLSPGTLPPAPLPAGAISSDGRWLAEVRGRAMGAGSPRCAASA